MFKRLITLISILLCCSCSEKKVETVTGIKAVGNYEFGSVPENKDSDSWEVPVDFLTDRDSLEIKVTPGSRRIWQIAIIVPEIPGEKDPLESLREAVGKRYSLKFGGELKYTFPRTTVELSRDFKRGSRGGRCTFTDLEMQKIALAEAADAGNQRKIAIRRAEDDIFVLEDAVTAFHDETGIYPGKLDDLLHDPGVKNWRGPYLKKLPQDPWGRAYCYEKNASGFTIYSTGADGRSKVRP